MNPSTAQAQVIVDELVRCGVRHVVVCPGSRNAPLSMALHEAATEGRLVLHVRIDERSGGFLALGLAKGLAGRGFAAVTCTSGTAVANLHPAVLEAHHSGTPLLLLTADRPAELHGTGANQTIDQRGLYGPAAPCVDFPVAERRIGQNPWWRGLVCRAVATAAAGGPVQLNLPFREPLVPDGLDDWPDALDGRADGAPWTAVSAANRPPEPSDVDFGARTVLVVGDGDDETARGAAGIAASAGWPVIAEPTGAATVLAAGAPLIRRGALLLSVGEPPEPLRPDTVVVAGRPTLHRGTARLLWCAKRVHLLHDGPQWTDAAHIAATVGAAIDPDRVAEPDPDWLPAWRTADRAADTALTAFLARDDAGDGGPNALTGLHVARELVAGLPADAVLFVGSSNAIRDVDLAASARADVTVVANRGVAGIDGNISTASGITIGSGRRGFALLGDLTFLHDINGLLIGPAEQRPDLTVVVLNDDGGGIFELLEQGDPAYAASFERVFGTPHGADLATLCAGYGVPHQLAGPGALGAALADGMGPRVVEVRVPRRGSRETQARLWAAVRDAITASIN